jgi:hypothetical protein
VPAIGTYRLRREVNCSSERRQEHSTAHRRGRLYLISDSGKISCYQIRLHNSFALGYILACGEQ